MYVQWCVKGMHLDRDSEAESILEPTSGLLSNWWRRVSTITPGEVRDRLTPENLDRHVNHFEAPDPATGLLVRHETPFISLSAGTIERDTFAKTNAVHGARNIAIRFGLAGGTTTAYLFVCWVILAPRPAVRIQGVAEEVRDLNAYRRYSAFQTEGEIVAKVNIPSNQIRHCERWDFDRNTKTLTQTRRFPNRHFDEPQILSNIREFV